MKTQNTIQDESIAIPTMDELIRFVEALLFVGAQPVNAAVVARTFPSMGETVVEDAVRILAGRYAQFARPLQIRRADAGFVLEVASGARESIEQRARSERGIKLARPMVEVLSMVAYRQPISREDLERKLGIDVRLILRKLVRERLIEITSPAANGEEDKYVTTDRFLELMNLETLEDLPATEDPQAL